MEMRSHHKSGTGRRLLAALLSLLLIATLLPLSPSSGAKAAEGVSWSQANLDKLVSWGIMRGDQSGSLDPNRAITRAEFVSLINRAYGYDTPGKFPFTDVAASDWYYDDIRVAYHTGYFTGTSQTTASPLSPLSREQATVILSRNLMLQEGLGETLSFSDSRNLGGWSRGLVKSASELGIIKGYPDGTFQPQRNISRGEVAAMLVTAIGSPINKPGDYTLGSVYSNVTISVSGVTLRNTVIAGDLYITGGVGLGHVTLENVTVLGKIVASGAGESNKGDSSIIMRNVTAPVMTVDSVSNQFVTVRAEGETKIEATNVRTPSYLEDTTGINHGFAHILLNGESGTSLEMAGTIKEVTILSPNASVKMAKGSAQILTVDEAAPGTVVSIESSAEVKNLNLDVATRLTGKGDAETLTINSAGSSASMLPDKIAIRPGLTANIAGESMDTVTAAESSEDPRLLSGYPKAVDLAPTAASALFRTNKRGTIYWAVSSISDGSVGETDLLNPPSYATKILKSGTITAANSNTDYTAKISNLTSDGSYYLSAIMVDARGTHSPVKVIAFSTPDGSTPGFANGYPVISKISNTSAQVTVMPTKTCQLYYALLPKGSTAPTAADFKANGVTGNLGFGSMEVTKNMTRVFTVNDRALAELETYDLYLWLTDLDGAKNSAVKKLNFTTVDRTPPVFLTEPTVNAIKETSVGLTATLNEAGTIYWVVVKQGESYPKPLAGQTQKPALSSDTAKLQVSSGMNALKSGKVSATANKDVAITISGLAAQGAYDLYYVAEDKAGNFSDAVKAFSIYTLDTTAPTVTQEFTRTNDTSGKNPLADTDIRLVFSEGIQDISGEILVDLYQTSRDTAKPESEQKAALEKLVTILREDVQLWDTTNVPASLVPERVKDTDTEWIVDYRYVKISMDDGKTILTFENGKSLNLKSGSSYYFQIANIADNSNNKNIIRPNPQKLDSFKTVFAQINLKRTSESSTGAGDLHMSFQLFPVSTKKVDPSIYWDMLIWSDSLIDFKLYRRETTEGGAFGPWQDLGEASILSTSGTFTGISMTKAFAEKLGGTNKLPPYQTLNTLDESKVYEYGIQITRLNSETDDTAWSQEVNVQISLAAGGKNDLDNLANDVSPQMWTTALADWDITSIGLPDPFALNRKFSDSKAPAFIGTYPSFTAGDVRAQMSVMLDRPGTVYYAVAPVTYTASTGKIIYSLTTAQKGPDNKNIDVLPDQVPTGGGGIACPTLTLPLNTTIVKPNFATNQIKSGSVSYSGTGKLDIDVSSLTPETMYYVYYVLKGTSSSSPFSEVKCFRFTTTEVKRPVITLDINNPSVNVTVSDDSLLDYILVVNGKEDAKFTETMDKHLADSADLSHVTVNGKILTVLDAMSSDAGGTGSLFDLYASDTSKNIYASLIRNQAISPSVVTLKGQNTFQASKPLTPVDCRPGMTGSTWYTFLTVGHSSSGSGDAFRAIRPVFLQDSDAPVINECTTVYTGGTPITASNQAFYGYLTIIFNEDLYFKTQSGSDQTVTPLEATANLTVGSKFKPIGSVITNMDPRISLKEGKAGESCSALTFNINGAFPGALISFNGNLCDESGNSRKDTPLTLKLTYEPQKQADGTTTYRGYFTITSSWDNTKKS